MVLECEFTVECQLGSFEIDREYDLLVCFFNLILGSCGLDAQLIVEFCFLHHICGEVAKVYRLLWRK